LAQTPVGKVQTVRGPIDPADLGPTLVHEHILVGFLGTERMSPERHDAHEVCQKRRHAPNPVGHLWRWREVMAAVLPLALLCGRMRMR
jgi:predicted metal-dependent phosphotriesterase family hydrolase